MIKQRTVITVRYLNKNGTLSRPHKIQKIITKEGDFKYFNMNNKWEIDPSTFTTNWVEKNKKQVPPKIKPTTIVEVIRVKFHVKKKDIQTLSKSTRIYKLTTGDKIEYKRYNSNKNYGAPLNPSEFITEWKKGPTPTPKPLRKYSDIELQKRGYTIDQIKEIRGRSYSAKDVKTFRQRMGGLKKFSAKEAREQLDKHKTINNAILANKEILNKVREDRIKSSNNVVHMGKITVKKRIIAKPNSRRYRKLLNQGVIDENGYYKSKRNKHGQNNSKKR